MSKSIKANTSGKTEYKKKNHFKMKDGDLVARIVPPMTKFTSNPKGWIRYHSIHLGYKNSEGKMRGFESPLVKNNNTKMVEVADPALDRFNDLKAKLEKAKEEGNGPLVAKLNTLVGYKGVYSVNNYHHMNVILLDGSIGELAIRYKAKLALDVEIKRLEAQSIDPLSEEDGRFFVFHRDGMSRDTNFTVSVYRDKDDKQVSHAITPELWNRLENEAFDLENEITNKLTADEVAQIVAESDLLSGKSPAVNRLIDSKYKKNNTTTESNNSDDELDDGDATMASAPAQAPTPTPAPKAAAPAAAPKAVSTAKTVTTPATTTVEEMSDDEFFETIGVKTASA